MRRYSYLFWGLLAGFLGGLAGGLVLWGSWLLPVLGLLLTRVNLVQGMVSLLILGSLGGLIYALLVGKRRMSLGLTFLAGLSWGVVLWIAGPLVLVPVLLGLPPQLSNPLDHWMPLAAFALYGLILSLLYSRWSAGQSRWRLYYALGLIFLAGWLTPFLLRAAISTDPQSLELLEGFQGEVVAKGLTYPTGLTFNDRGDIYLAEGGYSYGPKTTTARVLKIGRKGEIEEVARGFEGPLNGIAWHDGSLYISHRGKITVLDPESGEREDLVTGLPSLGDHQNNDLLAGKDGALYFGQGTATNAGVVGYDNFLYAWADRYPEFHDFPSRDFTLTGENYSSRDPGSAEPAAEKKTGAFAPFGQTRAVGEKVKGTVPASGAVHRLDLETGELTVYADGLRNPFGLARDEQGNLYATNLGYDDRGVRAVKGSPDWLVLLKEGAWYGWPDYAGEISLQELLFTSRRGVNRKALIADPPPVQPPLATFPPHYSPMKLDYAPDNFPAGGLFVAVFGDGQPLTEDLERPVPTGVLQVNPTDGRFRWFVKNRGPARTGRLGGGLKRAIDVKFNAAGEMYLLDFGVMEFTGMAPNSIPGSGVLWKITPVK